MRRVVSLVPSISESLFELGFGEVVVGITDYCIYPAEPLESLPRIGGTKNPRLEEIVALQPDVVFANQEENTQAAVEGLRAAGLNVIVHFPLTVQQAVADLSSMAALFGSHAAQAQVDLLAEQVAATRQRNPAGLPVFVPIWYQPGLPEWWMTFNQHTFTHDVLTLCGFQSIFAARERRYPLAADLGSKPAKPAEGRDTRYPRVDRRRDCRGRGHGPSCCPRSRMRLRRRISSTWPVRWVGIWRLSASGLSTEPAFLARCAHRPSHPCFAGAES